MRVQIHRFVCEKLIKSNAKSASKMHTTFSQMLIPRSEKISSSNGLVKYLNVHQQVEETERNNESTLPSLVAL